MASEDRSQAIAEEILACFEKIMALAAEARQLGVLDQISQEIAPKFDALEERFEALFNGD